MAENVATSKGDDGAKVEGEGDSGDKGAGEIKNPAPKAKETEKNKASGGDNTGGENVINDDMFFKYASEKLQKEVKSFEDLVVEKEKTREYASEFSEKYDKFYEETKGSVENFQFVQKDIDAMEQEDLIREILSSDNPELNAEDINSLYEDEYSFNKEYDDEKVVKRKKIAIKQAAARGKKELKARQDKFKLKGENKEAGTLDFGKQVEAHNAKVKEDFEVSSTHWKKTLGESVKDFDGVELKIAEDLDFKFSPTEDQKMEAYNTTADITFQELVKPYSNKEGAINTKALHQAIFKMKNFDSIFDAGIKQAIAYGRELEIKERVNPRNKTTNSMASVNTDNLSAEDKFRVQMASRSRFKK